eukprot:Platyproteum_vivax@DN2688_c0_g1_i1.p1
MIDCKRRDEALILEASKLESFCVVVSSIKFSGRPAGTASVLFSFSGNIQRNGDAINDRDSKFRTQNMRKDDKEGKMVVGVGLATQTTLKQLSYDRCIPVPSTSFVLASEVPDSTIAALVYSLIGMVSGFYTLSKHIQPIPNQSVVIVTDCLDEVLTLISLLICENLCVLVFCKDLEKFVGNPSNNTSLLNGSSLLSICTDPQLKYFLSHDTIACKIELLTLQPLEDAFSSIVNRLTSCHGTSSVILNTQDGDGKIFRECILTLGMNGKLICCQKKGQIDAAEWDALYAKNACIQFSNLLPIIECNLLDGLLLHYLYESVHHLLNAQKWHLDLPDTKVCRVSRFVFDTTTNSDQLFVYNKPLQ